MAAKKPRPVHPGDILKNDLLVIPAPSRTICATIRGKQPIGCTLIRSRRSIATLLNHRCCAEGWLGNHGSSGQAGSAGAGGPAGYSDHSERVSVLGHRTAYQTMSTVRTISNTTTIR